MLYLKKGIILRIPKKGTLNICRNSAQEVRKKLTDNN